MILYFITVHKYKEILLILQPIGSYMISISYQLSSHINYQKKMYQLLWV